MRAQRLVSLGLRVAFGALWAGCLVVLGLAVAFGGLGLPVTPGARTTTLLGIACIAGGLFIYMVFVADRLIPAVGLRQTMWRVEMAMVMAFLCGGAAALWTALAGGGAGA